MPLSKEQKAVWGWALYDWANSAFATTVMAGFFPIFFKEYWSAGVEPAVSTARLGFGNSLASLLVAIFAPLFGAIADRCSARKRFLAFFTLLGCLMTAGLAALGRGQWSGALLLYAGGFVGFSFSMTFYDALLPGVVPEKSLDRASSLGYSLGYLGGGLLFLVNVLMATWPAAFGLSDSAAAVRLSFLSVALWWGGFSLFTFLWVQEGQSRGKRPGLAAACREGFSRLTDTLREVRRHRNAWLFLAAYWLYIDGVDTVIRMAVDYGLSLGFRSTDLIAALLLVQFVGFPATLVYGRLGDRLGAKRAILLGLAAYVGITLWGARMTSRWEFYALAVVIALVQGGVQALSRSCFARFVPPGRQAEYFGFYNMLGKFAAIAGPALMAGVGLMVRHLFLPATPTPADLATVNQLAARWGISSLILLFVGGAFILLRVDGNLGGSRHGTNP